MYARTWYVGIHNANMTERQCRVIIITINNQLSYYIITRRVSNITCVFFIRAHTHTAQLLLLHLGVPPCKPSHSTSGVFFLVNPTRYNR